MRDGTQDVAAKQREAAEKDARLRRLRARQDEAVKARREERRAALAQLQAELEAAERREGDRAARDRDEQRRRRDGLRAALAKTAQQQQQQQQTAGTKKKVAIVRGWGR